MNPIIVGSLIGAIVSLVFWSLAGWQVRQVISEQPVLHRALVYMTIASFLMIDLFTFAALQRVGVNILGPLYAFSTGLQMTAAIAAVIFIRQVRRRD